ncbi:MAG: CRISPR-associated protein Cas4 [bacterium]
MKKYSEFINIRSIQHFLYCPHRWGLMEFNCNFAENYYVYRGNLVHKNIDNKKGVRSRGVIHENSVNVYNDDWNIYGVIDCLELCKSNSTKSNPTPYIEKYNNNFLLTIVEYKASAPKKNTYRYEDKMQVLAQKICVDNLFNTNCDCYFYYANTKKRIKIDFISQDYIFLKNTLNDMQLLSITEEIPKINPKQRCYGCSIKNICLPKK